MKCLKCYAICYNIIYNRIKYNIIRVFYSVLYNLRVQGALWGGLPQHLADDV